MTRRSDPPKVVVVYPDGSPCSDADTMAALADRGLLDGQVSGQRAGQMGGHSFGQSFGQPFGQRVGQNYHPENVSAQMSGGFPRGAHEAILARGDSVPRYDPHRVHREFPDRWQSYILANYRDFHHVMRVFGVSERTARKWWRGETGANGGHVAIAVNEHPVAAPRMLFAAE